MFPVVDVLKGAFDIGNKVVNHFFPPKASEKELLEYARQEHDAELKNAAAARALAMIEARTQRKPWIVRLINGLFRPVVGVYVVFMATICTQVGRWFWGQLLHIDIPQFQLSNAEIYLIGSLAVSVINFYYGLITWEKNKGIRSKD